MNMVNVIMVNQGCPGQIDFSNAGRRYWARECLKEVICFRWAETGLMRSECPMREQQIGSQGREMSPPSVHTINVAQSSHEATATVRLPLPQKPVASTPVWMVTQPGFDHDYDSTCVVWQKDNDGSDGRGSWDDPIHPWSEYGAGVWDTIRGGGKGSVELLDG